ncbi:MAG: prolyl aminopeptidase [Betaproteobacteria bacterium]|nr:prolyl aminopeptidase [Betaproteobacteria bacterium]
MNDHDLPRQSALYPPLEPFDSGLLDVGHGHRVHFEQCGRPDGRPVLFLHGGPGSACKPDHRRYFDPAYYRVVLFDQRGCGRSRPFGATVHNTTPDLIADIERLRDRLGIQRWVLFGGSWGSTLALAYAQAHPGRVERLVLRGIFLASQAELDWYFTGLRHFIPEARERLFEGTARDDWHALLTRYDALLNDPDPAVATAAAHRWNAYESAIMSIGEPAPTSPAADTDSGSLGRARVQVHYLAHGCFLEDGQLAANLPRIAHLPAVLLHGRQDFVCPPVTAYELARNWPAAKLAFIETAKHASSHPDLERALVAAVDAIRDAAGSPAPP